jgi:hypothetical protein
MTSDQDHRSSRPAAFSALDALPDSWAPETEVERRERRATANMDDLRNFYATLGPLIPTIAEHLERFSIDAPLPPPEKRLFRLAQMYMEAAWAVEVLGQPEEADQVPRQRWAITPLLPSATRRMS